MCILLSTHVPNVSKLSFLFKLRRMDFISYKFFHNSFIHFELLIHTEMFEWNETSLISNIKISLWNLTIPLIFFVNFQFQRKKDRYDGTYNVQIKKKLFTKTATAIKLTTNILPIIIIEFLGKLYYFYRCYFCYIFVYHHSIKFL